MEREGQRKMKWAKFSGAVRHSLQVESPGSVPFILRRNLSLQAITANQHSNSEVGSAGAWLVDRAGWRTNGGRVYRGGGRSSQSDSLVFSSLLLEFFQEALPLGLEISCSRDGRLASSPGSLLKNGGGGESLVTSAGKAVDFRRVIIHVINVGRSHFSDLISCLAISVVYRVAA